MAKGSITETQNHLRDAVDRRYWTETECRPVTHLAARAIAATTSLIRYLRRCSAADFDGAADREL